MRLKNIYNRLSLLMLVVCVALSIILIFSQYINNSDADFYNNLHSMLPEVRLVVYEDYIVYEMIISSKDVQYFDIALVSFEIHERIRFSYFSYENSIDHFGNLRTYLKLYPCSNKGTESLYESLVNDLGLVVKKIYQREETLLLEMRTTYLGLS